jgi:hypothetical protein
MYSASLRGGIREKTDLPLHSPTSATGTGWEPTPWHATQRAVLMDSSVSPEAQRPVG